MSELSLNTILTTPGETSNNQQRNPEKIRDAAKQFESLLIEQMMKSAHGSAGWMGSGEDETGAPLSEMAEQQFAQLLSNNGGLGLAKLVVDGLAARTK